MFTHILKSAITGLLLLSSVAMAQDGIYFNVASGDKEEAYNDMVNDKIESIGFLLSNPHERINEAFKIKYGTKGKSDYDSDYKQTLDNLGFFSVVNEAALRPLLLKEPRLGAFSLFNLYLYKYSDEDLTRVGHVNPEVMLDIVGVKDKGVRTDFIKMFVSLDKMVDTEIGGKKEVVTFDKLPKKSLIEYELKFERPDDILDFIEDFQEAFEGAFEENDYIIAGHKSFSEAYADMGADFSKYDAYFIYSICKFDVSYRVFNHGNAQAGAFAPCSMYMYIEKDSNILKIGMSSVENWISVAGVKDPAQVKSIHALDKQIIKIMVGLGAELK